MEKLKDIILVEIEAEYGTDPTPIVAADEIIVHGTPTFQLVTKVLERPVPLPYFGKIAPVIVGEAYKLSFKAEITPSGAAGTAPRFGKLLRAAGLTEAISAGASATYTPHSTHLGESCTIYYWAGGVKHILRGCVANIKIPLVAGEMILADVEVTGLYGGTIADVAFPTPTFETASPLIWTAAAFKFSAITTLICSKLDFDLGNEIAPRRDANAALTPGISRYFIKDRNPKVSFDIEKEDLSTINPYTLHSAQTLSDLETKPTGTAGSKIEILINDIALDAPSFGDKESVRVWNLSGAPKVTLAAGNAEFSIAFK